MANKRKKMQKTTFYLILLSFCGLFFKIIIHGSQNREILFVEECLQILSYLEHLFLSNRVHSLEPFIMRKARSIII